MSIIGIVGLVCIAAAWIPPTVKTVKHGFTELPLSFLVLTAAGNLSLTAYSILILDPIYLTLNALALLQGSVNLYYRLFPRSQ
ncbi:MAG: hypothetical protein HY562_02450 [Ignavibacteriales bacterium]|nr:hypothetical protein [Ignavibacteriales bacterium]